MWQAAAYSALAKVPGGKAWTPDLAATAQGMNLGPGGRVVHVDVASVGGPPPARNRGLRNDFSTTNVYCRI